MSTLEVTVDDITASSLEEAVDDVLVNGVSVLRDWIDVEFLKDTCSKSTSPELSDLAEEVNISSILGVLVTRGLPEINSAMRLDTEIGEPTPPHTDDWSAVKGVSLLLPVRHFGKFAVHRDETPHYMLEETEYFPGDMLLLRQRFEFGDGTILWPTWHSSCSERLEGDDSEFRQLLVLDHRTKQ